MPSTEQGHHEKRVYLHQDGRLVVPSSAKILIEGSTRGNYGSGARMVNRNISVTTSRTTALSPTEALISNSGVTIIVTTAVGTLRLDRPIKGVEKTIIWASTASKLVKVRVTPLVDTDATVKVSASYGKKNPDKGATCFYPTTGMLKSMKTAKYGLPATIVLVGQSTSRWFVKSLSGGDTTGIHFWKFATST